MPARDIYHFNVKNALIKDGWSITHDPLTLRWGTADLFVDLGAEQLLAAEKQERKIAVEVKSFIGASITNDLENALGQYILYQDVLLRMEPDRYLYLAVHEEALRHLMILLVSCCSKTSVFRLLFSIQSRRRFCDGYLRYIS